MATNATTLSLSFATTSSSSSLHNHNNPLLRISKRFVSFSTLPYPSLSHFVVTHSPNPRVSTPFALAAVVNGEKNDAVSTEEEKPRKLGNPTQNYDVGGREVRVKFSVQMNTKKKNLETLPPVRTIYYEGPYKVYVGNLARSTTPEEDVRRLFGKFGNVASVRVLLDLKQGKNRVYAFVSYLSQTECDASMSLNGTEFGSRTIVVRASVERTET